jgi:hypothetical protein
MIRFLMLSAAFTVAFLQGHPSRAKDTQENPNQWMAEVVANEVKAQQDDHSMWRYKRLQRVDRGVTEELEMIDTPLGTIHRLLKRNGEALSADDASREDDRILHLVSNPKEVQKRTKQELKDAEEEREMLKMLPVAFDFRYVGSQDGVAKLDFSPRQGFKPQRREEQVFHHMVGTIFVHVSQKRLVAIEGKLVDEVKFGDGVLGYLSQGGTFQVHQADVGSGHWEMTHLSINMHGKALFFKTIGVNQSQDDYDFRPVRGNITLTEAAKMLRESLPAAPRASQRSLTN